MGSVDEELLTATGILAAHSAITSKYLWFLHIKPVRLFAQIKADGLRPSSQGCPVNDIVATALRGLVPNVEEMIFLRPVGDDVLNTTPNRGEKMFALAIPKSALPRTVTVDWTFGGTFGLADIIKADKIKEREPIPTNEEIFCEVVRRRGSVAIYEALPPAALKVWTKEQPFDDPSKWPDVVHTVIEDIEQIG
jgi:hypothetical protein